MATAVPPMPEPLLDLPLPVGPHGAAPTRFAEIRETHPVCPVRMPSGDVLHLLTRHDDIQATLRDPRFSRNLTAPGGPRILGPGVETIPGGLFNLDAPDHTRVRRIIAPFYTPRAVDRHEEMIRGHVVRRVEAIAAGPNPADLHTALSAPLSLEVSCDALGISHEQRHEIGAAFQIEIEPGHPHEVVQDATDRIVSFSRALADSGEVREDGPIGALIAAHRHGRISYDELTGTIVFLFVTAIDPVIGPLSMGVLTLLRHPDQLARVLREPALWPRAVEEVLRFHHNGQISFARVALEDVELHGTTIHKGQSVVTPMLAATDDPRRFKHPDRFNIDRESGNTHFADATFGGGPHHCLGAHFARRYLTVALSTLFTRLPGLALAVPAEDIPWDETILFTRPTCLPVTWR